jgi:hypothetical protein
MVEIQDWLSLLLMEPPTSNGISACKPLERGHSMPLSAIQAIRFITSTT